MSITFTCAPDSVILRNPELGNSLLQDIKTIFRRAMDGTMHSFKRTPVSQVLKLTFIHITRVKVLEMITLLKNSAGQIVTYTDHEAVVWTGYIRTSPIEFATQVKMDCDISNPPIEASTFTIDFEGTHG